MDDERRAQENDPEFGRTRWRKLRDPRGRSVPASVVDVVARVHARVFQARLAEGLGFAIALGFAAASAGLLSGAARSLELTALSACVGLLGGATWVLGSRVRVERLVRRLDRRLRFGGALVTAWEGERDGAQGPLATLLDERVRERLRPVEARRVAVPGLGVPVVTILAAGAGWLVALELEPDPPAPVDVAALVDGARARLSAARREALEALEEGALDPDQAQAFVEVLEACEILDAEASPEELARLDGELAERARRVADRPDLAGPLEEARAQLDAARDALARREEGGPADAGAGGADASGGGELTNAGPDGTMSGSTGASQGAADVSTDPGPDPGDGARATPAAPELAAWSAWWPEEYDALVRGWVDRRRQ